MPHVAQPNPTSNHNDRLNPIPRRAARIAAVAAIPLAAICNKFPQSEPSGLGPMVTMIVTCSATKTTNRITNLRAKRGPPGGCIGY